MNPKQNPLPSRAIELWKRFVGMFGGDSVLRKFGDEPPQEWIAVVEKLRDFELERGMRRLVYSGKGHVPTLPEFVKLCRAIGGLDDIDEGPQAPALPRPEAFSGDRWDEAANDHLRAHITRQLAENPQHYGRPATFHGMRNMTREEHPNADASPEFVRAVGMLVTAKKLWARDMRESDAEGLMPADAGKAWFREAMQRAEEAIAQKVAA